MKANFAWVPDYGFDRTIKSKAKTINFGDGYEQRMAVGINTRQSEWSLTFQRPIAEIDQIRAFLEARNGTESFDFAAPNGTTYRVVTNGDVCKVSDSDYGMQVLTTTFKQVFE